jgi:hypothetical protein
MHGHLNREKNVQGFILNANLARLNDLKNIKKYIVDKVVLDIFINKPNMITVHNLLTGEIFRGDAIEFFIDEDTAIGEVYLDGDLIYQCIDKDVQDEDDLEIEFNRIFEVTEFEEETDEYDSGSYEDDYYE